MKVAILHYDWFLQIHTKLLIEGLLKEGNFVDLYLYNMRENYVCLKQHEHLNVVEQKTHGSFFIFFSRCLHYIYRRVYCFRGIIEFIYSIYLNLDVRRFRIPYSYDFAIGMDKGGGILAREQSKKNQHPYIYYSLELNSENTDYSYDVLASSMVRQEKSVAEKAKAIIIQDTSRSEVFSQRLGDDYEFIYLPVSVLKPNTPVKEKIKRCVVFGNNHFISNDDIVTISKNIPDDWSVLFHNIKLSKEKFFVKEHNINNIIISEGSMKECEISHLLSTSMIGLALYGNNDENVQKIIFSSEKIARYLGAGLPIITTTLGNSSILFKKFRCGLAINNFLEIGEAIMKISLDYERYSAMAHEAFEEYYNFDKNFDRIYPRIIAIGKQQ